MTGRDERIDWLPDDVRARLAADFPGEPLATLAAVLSQYSGPERVRVVRCVVQLARGDLHRLRQNIEAAAADYRDVMYWAEYDAQGQRIRDYSQPF